MDFKLATVAGCQQREVRFLAVREAQPLARNVRVDRAVVGQRGIDGAALPTDEVTGGERAVAIDRAGAEHHRAAARNRAAPQHQVAAATIPAIGEAQLAVVGERPAVDAEPAAIGDDQQRPAAKRQFLHLGMIAVGEARPERADRGVVAGPRRGDRFAPIVDVEGVSVVVGAQIPGGIPVVVRALAGPVEFNGAGCQRHRQQNPAQDQAEGGGAMAAFHVAWGGMGAAGDGHGFA